MSSTRLSALWGGGSALKKVCASVVVAVAAMHPPVAPAATIYNCGSTGTDFGTGCSLAELFGGGTIFVDEIGFVSWNLLDEKFPGQVNPTLIEVVGVESGSEVGVGIVGNGQFLSALVENFYDFHYRVLQASGAGPLDASTLSIRGLGDAHDIKGFTILGDGPADARVRETVVLEGAVFLGTMEVGGSQFSGVLTESPHESLAFPSPLTEAVDVFTRVLYSGFGGIDNIPPSVASVDFFYETFRRVPEPGTVSLLAIAALGFAIGPKRSNFGSHVERTRGRTSV